MDAGRELDAAVAERVMGLVWDEKRCPICGWPLVSEDMFGSTAGCLPDNCSLRPPPTRRADEHAHYSTDIAAAWLVVEALRGRGYRLNLYETLDGAGYCAMFIGSKSAARTAPTAPEAICRAALAAMEESK